MTDPIDTEIRSALAVMVADAPDPLSFDDLARHTASPSASRTRWSPVMAFSVAFAAVVIVIGAAALFLGPFDGGSSPASEVPATATTVPPETLSPSGWSRVSHDANVFGEARMLSVVAGGPGFVAVGWTGSSPSEGHVDGDAAVWTSVDGITWEPVPNQGNVFTDAKMARVIVGGPGFVAVGNLQGDDDWAAAVWTSPDGLTWTRVPHDEAVFGEASMGDVTVGGPGLVAVGDVESGAAVWTSVDGTIWTRVPHDPAVFGDDSDPAMSAITAGGPGLVAVGLEWAGGTAHAAIWTSVDGFVWDRVPHDEDLFGGVGNQAAGSVAVVGTRVVAVGTERSSDIDAAVWTSEDGLAWQRVPNDQEALSEGLMWDVTVGGAGLVSVGWIGWVGGQNSDAAIWTSVDGITWERIPHDEALFGGVEMWGVAAGGPGLVAVGSDGTDAAVWTFLLND